MRPVQFRPAARPGQHDHAVPGRRLHAVGWASTLHAPGSRSRSPRSDRSTDSSAADQHATSSKRVPARSPATASTTAATSDQQGQLDRVVDPVERHEPRRAAQPREPAGLGHCRRSAVSGSRSSPAACAAGGVHHVVERLVQHSTRTASSAPSVIQPPSSRAPPSARTPSAERDQRLGDGSGPSLSRKIRPSRRTPPARHLAVHAVQEHLQLGEQHREDRPGEPRHEQRRAGRQPLSDHQPGHAVRADAGRQQHPGQVRRDPAHVEVAGPVLGAARPVTAGGWVTARICATDGRPVIAAKPPTVGTPREAACALRAVHVIATAGRRYPKRRVNARAVRVGTPGPGLHYGRPGFGRRAAAARPPRGSGRDRRRASCHFSPICVHGVVPAFSLAATPSCVRSCSSSISRLRPAAIAPTSSGGTRMPSCPSSMMSRGPRGQSKLTTGSPALMASMITIRIPRSESSARRSSPRPSRHAMPCRSPHQLHPAVQAGRR